MLMMFPFRVILCIKKRKQFVSSEVTRFTIKCSDFLNEFEERCFNPEFDVLLSCWFCTESSALELGGV